MEAALLLARAHYMRRRYREADDALAEVEGTDIGSEELAGEYLIQRVGILFWGLEQPQEARALIRRARDWCPGDVWRARLQAMDLQVVTLSEGFAGSVEASEKLLADTTLSERTRLRMQGVHLANLYYSGRAREAYALSLRLRPPIPIPHQGDEYTLMVCAAVGVQTGEDWPEVRRWTTQMMRDAVRQNDHFAAGSAATVLGNSTSSPAATRTPSAGWRRARRSSSATTRPARSSPRGCSGPRRRRRPATPRPPPPCWRRSVAPTPARPPRR